MPRYVYAYDIEWRHDEAFFVFPKFAEIISGVEREEYDAWNDREIEAHATDAVITALQAIIALGDDIPEPDSPRLINASGFVCLKPIQAMKLQVYRVYRANGCRSVADFARRIGKQDTTARRLLNLRHRSMPDEIDEALRVFGKVLEHEWDVGVVTPSFRAAGTHAREPAQG